jgi:hypothetical protein
MENKELKPSQAILTPFAPQNPTCILRTSYK